MTLTAKDKSDALTLSSDLLMRQINLCSKNIFNDTAKLLINKAEREQISVADAYLSLCVEYDELEKKQDAILAAAYKAYDDHIHNNHDELTRLQKLTTESASNIQRLQKEMASQLSKLNEKKSTLENQGFSTTQIDHILSLEPQFNEAEAIAEIKAKEQEFKLANEDLKQIYTEAKQIQMDMIYGT